MTSFTYIPQNTDPELVSLAILQDDMRTTIVCLSDAAKDILHRCTMWMPATSIFCLQLSSTRMRGGGLQIL
jgi:hypothetical protein